MTTVTRTFEVQADPTVVIDYLKDFSHAEEWDPGTQSCSPLTEPPVTVGSRWHNESKIAGVSTELVYELIALEEGRLVFKGSNDTATTTDTITASPLPEGGSRVSYEAVIEMSGAAKLADPVVKLVFEKVGKDTEDNLVRVLNGLAVQG